MVILQFLQHLFVTDPVEILVIQQVCCPPVSDTYTANELIGFAHSLIPDYKFRAAVLKLVIIIAVLYTKRFLQLFCF